MITREEIDERAADLDINPSDLQRDYLFGWLLAGLYEEGAVAKLMVLKGGNCLRKAYFKDARFSRDLDFGCAAVHFARHFAVGPVADMRDG